MGTIVDLNPLRDKALILEQVGRISEAAGQIVATVDDTMTQLEWMADTVSSSEKPSPDIDAEIRDEIMNLAADLQDLWLNFGGTI